VSALLQYQERKSMFMIRFHGANACHAGRGWGNSFADNDGKGTVLELS
jgi:hypothetical protein